MSQLRTEKTDDLMVFSTALGWMAVRSRGECLCELTFGHASPDAALAALHGEGNLDGRMNDWRRELRNRLVAYAMGTSDDFQDIELDLDGMTPFRRRVTELCRRVPAGRTTTYAQLAERAGAPGAARAVGNCMARNPFPLVVPCHRVLGAGGSLGGYSAPGGTDTKVRLLRLEGIAVAV